ncbi:hypothetical protein H3V53_36605 [Paraburkholderia bengalensis]|uniref:Uncharacterized protein n=1 Tax=Paraburkholderia bengalensis TaxID=2747562 RepID=A0ABU8J3C0_9BURK
MDLQKELEELRRADEHVALARRCVEQQRQIASRLAAGGRDASMARQLLRTMEETVTVASLRRALISRVVASCRAVAERKQTQESRSQ